MRESAPQLRDAVINGFAFEPSVLAKVSTPETLDQIIINGGVRLGDAGFAAEFYDDLCQQAIDAPARLHAVRISIRLSPLPMGRGTVKGRASLYVAIVRREYSLISEYPTPTLHLASTLTDNGMVFTTRLSGGKGGRNCLETELRRLKFSRRTAARTIRSPAGLLRELTIDPRATTNP